MPVEENLNSIDNAISVCQETIKKHKWTNTVLITLLVAVTSFSIAYLFLENYRTSDLLYNLKPKSLLWFEKDTIPVSTSVAFSDSKIQERINEANSHATIYNRAVVAAADAVREKEVQRGKLSLIQYGIFILVFGVITSFYRYHLKEISKYEHILSGYHRIRIAGNNYSDIGYQSEVRDALTKDAFTTESSTLFGSKKKVEVENPMPGIISLDIAAKISSEVASAIKAGVEEFSKTSKAEKLN